MTCPHCGTDTPAGAARCAGCGAPPSAPADATLGPGVDVTMAANPDVTIAPVDPDATAGAPGATAFQPIAHGATGGVTGGRPLDPDATRIPISEPTGARTANTGGTPRQFQMLTPGETLGARYHIIRLLGVGGMGAVYHAWDAELGVAVALKVIRGDITGDPDATAAIERQFKRELLLARQVTHKHVVRIHDLGDIDGIKYITMPYVQGSDLASVLKEAGKLPIARTLRYITQIVGGLVAAHEAGVVHRDLKPANIMIDQDDQALIMDFGIAHSSSATGSASSQVVGTLAYMAPEQAQAKPTDQRADVYALGMMLREMLVGKKPSSDGQQALADLMERVKTAPPPLRTIDDTIPEPLDEVAARCVAPDPANRYQSSAELLDALAALDDEGHLRPIPKAVLSPWRMTVAAVVVVATIGVMGVVYRKTTPAAPKKAIDPVSILVADFENKTGDSVFDGALEQPLTIAMEGASFITSYSRAAALKLAQSLGNAARLDAATARPVAFREGVKYVLAGSITSAGGKYQLAVDALEPATGKALKSATATAGSKDDVLKAVGVLASTIRTGLGDTATDAAKTAAAETFTAGSIEAMREYSQAQDLQNGGKNEEALAHYEKAFAIDPKFGRAYSGAANIDFRLGRQAEGEAAFKQALALTDRMTDREKHRTLGSYYLQVTHNYEKAVEEYSALVRAYPSDGGGYANLAFAYFGVGDYQKAMEVGRRAVDAYPGNLTAKYNQALFAMYAGNFENAMALAKAVVKENPSLVKAYLPIAIDAIIKGDLDGARSAYDGMAAGAGAPGESLAAIGRADLALYVGRPQGVAAGLRPNVAADLTSQSTTPAAVKQILIAEAELAAGRQTQAVDAAHAALKITHQLEVVVPAARVLIQAGKAADAKALVAELEAQLPKQSRAYAKILAAEMAMHDKNYAPAIDLLNQAIALSDLWLARFDRGVAYLLGGSPPEAQPEFEACLKRRGEATALFFDDRPTMRYLATLPYWQGRTQEGLFQTAAAKTSFESFLKVRADAKGDPLVADAQKRLAAQ